MKLSSGITTIALAAGLIFILTVVLRQDDGGERRESEALAETVAARGDAADPWGNSGGLITAAQAIIIAEVVDTTGPKISLRDDGNIEWSLEESDRIAEEGGGPSEFMPGLTIRVVDVLADEGRVLPKTGSEMHVILSAGVLKPGTEYAMFLGPESDDTGESRWLTYAHDLESDQPADGFRFGATEILEDVADAARAGDRSNLETIVAFNADIHAGASESRDRSALFDKYVASSSPSETIAPQINEDLYPQFEDDAYAGDRSLLSPVEFVVVGDPATNYGVRGEKDLIWFGSDDAGIAYGIGYLPLDTTLELIRSDASLRPEIVKGMEFSLRTTTTEDGRIYFFVNVETGAVTQVSSIAELDELAWPFESKTADAEPALVER